MNKSGKNILFIVPYPPGEAPSQRFRFEQYLPLLKEEGYGYDIRAFLDVKAWKIFYKKGKTLTKAFLIFKGYLKRYLLLFQIRKYDHIYVHREFGPMGPPILGWLIQLLAKRSFIFDFDDAIWLPNHSDSNRIFKFLKPPGNAFKLMTWSRVNICGNHYLCDVAEKYNPESLVIPTTIDLHNRHNKINHHKNKTPVVGWTGSHSTIKYLNDLVPILQDLEKQYSFRFRVISDIDPELPLKGFEFIKWNAETEIEDLAAINIGLMPLPDTPWTRGKCGLKAIQYMALGIPPLLSPVGFNNELIEHGVQGYYCKSDEDWFEFLGELIGNPTGMREMGSKTRAIIEERYSTQSNRSKFLLLFAN